jgi:hypothetical protein
MRQDLILNKCVGIDKDGELILVNYLFNDDSSSEPFHGATGSRFVGVTQAEIDDRNDLEAVTETWGYLWQEAVECGATELSQEEYMQDLIRHCDGDYLGHDTSDIHFIQDTIKKMHFDGCETFECVGGGRMFPIKREDMMLIFDEDLFSAIEAIEELPQHLEVFQEVLGGELKTIKGA